MGFGADEIVEKNRVYRESFRNRRAEDQVGMAPPSACPACDGRARARRLGLRGQRFFANRYQYWYQGEAADVHRQA
ncbi:hypothetical protein AB5I41_14260 [Sphingomonas sp. MMS24-JH45]